MQQEPVIWRERAVAYLRCRTRTMREVIKRFVYLFWDRDVSDEADLSAFESCKPEIQSAYTF